jgi:hypothetical protein
MLMRYSAISDRSCIRACERGALQVLVQDQQLVPGTQQ